jgi:hypothetical protein
MDTQKKPRRARPCAVCQSVKVIDSYLCRKCQEKWKDELDSEWIKYCIEESDATDRLIRTKSRHEVPLETSGMVE